MIKIKLLFVLLIRKQLNLKLYIRSKKENPWWIRRRNSKNSSNELNDELNKTYKKKKNYNFSSRFKLKTYKSTYNLNSFISEKNKINKQNSKLLELKNTINGYNKNK